MDVSTALATAGVSAVVSAVVSLAAVATVTVRQERAKKREAAREAVRSTVQPLQNALARYVFATGRDVPKRELGGAMALDDLADAMAVAAAAEPLPRWRRRLIDRRLGRIYGRAVVTLIRDYPTSKGTFADRAFTTWLSASLMALDMSDHPNQSLLHRTYSKPPTSGTGKALARELRLLREAR